MKIDERDGPLGKPCPHCKKKKGIERLIEAPMTVEAVDGQLKHSGAFREVMAKVKAAHPKGNWGKRTGNG